MNDQQRAAMQMALEALEYAHEEKVDYMVRNNLGDPYKETAAKLAIPAITTLRESLAQPQDNLNCKSVQARLATSWGYVKEQPQGEWVELEGKEWRSALKEAETIVQKSEPLEALLQVFGERLLAKFKEKNTPTVVPKEVTEGNASEVRSADTGEPVGYLVYSLDGVNFQDSYCEGSEPVYTAPPVVPQYEHGYKDGYAAALKSQGKPEYMVDAPVVHPFKSGGRYDF